MVTVDGVRFHPDDLHLREVPGNKAPALLSDGDSVTFCWNARRFERPGYLPREIVVVGDERREYRRKLNRRERAEIASMVKAAVEHDAAV